jgi:hypothetical protein
VLDVIFGTLELRGFFCSLEVLHRTTDESGTEMFRGLALQERARTRETAGGHGLAVQFARTDPGKYSFSLGTAETWNKLPEEVRAARNRAAFIDMMKNLRETEIQGKDNT